MSRYRFIKAQRGQHPVRLLHEVLRVPASRYYSWLTCFYFLLAYL